MKSSNRKIFTAVACAALVLVCATAFVVGAGDNIFGGGTADDLGFVITAYAEGQSAEEATVLGCTTVEIDKNYPLIDKDYDKNGEFVSYVVHDLSFGVEGKNIASFDAKSEKGYVAFTDADKHRLSEKNATKNGKVYDYYVFDTQLFDLPVDSEGSYISWYPGCVMNDNSKETVYSRDELIKTAEDYTEYFGDTVTITVEYKDGTEKTVEIHLTFDEKGYVSAVMSENTDEVEVH